MRLLAKTFLICTLIIGCQTRQSKPEAIHQFHTIDYIEVGKLMQRIQPPYVINVTNKNKHLVFIGCNHTRDPSDEQFASIEEQFDRLKPQIAFNEGGQVGKDVHYSSLQQAAAKAGETGCLKYLCDRSRICLLNGDTPDSLELAIIKRSFPSQELYLYYVMERIVIPYLSIQPKKESFDKYFNRVITSFVSEHFFLTNQERSIDYFKRLYLKFTKRPFVINMGQEIEKFDYINGGDCHFCVLGRRSKMIRDSILLTKIDQAFDQYDRVMVTFGYGHALAIEPALNQIISKKR